MRMQQCYLRIALRARSASGLLDALGLGYDLPVGQAVYAIDAFPDDDLLWRIEWIDDVLDTAGRSEIRLYKESRSQAWSRRRARGGGDRGTAQFKTTYDRFSYTLRATGHENTLAFELIAKNDKRIAVGHILPQEIVIRQMFEPSGRAG